MALLGVSVLLGGAGCADPKMQCDSDADCFTDSGYRCDLGVTGFCLRACDTPGDDACLASQTCDLSNPTQGVCRDRSLSTGGGTGGTGGDGGQPGDGGSGGGDGSGS